MFLGVLGGMEAHVIHLATAPLDQLPGRFTVIAARQLNEGELATPDATKIYPH